MVADTAGTLLLLFAREPVAGQVKTRMRPQLSAEQACRLHCELVDWTCRRLLQARCGDVELCVTGDTGHPLFENCLALGAARVTRQRGADLGERMWRALRCALRRYRRVLLVGSDCPDIDGDYLGAALGLLDEVPVVLGPAEDGGYVLLGARVAPRAAFTGIDWGSSRVFEQTVAALGAESVAWRALPPLGDVDRPADLSRWEAIRGEGATPGGSFAARRPLADR